MTSDDLLAARLRELGSAAPQLEPGTDRVIPRAKRRRAAARALAAGAVVLVGGGLAVAALTGGPTVIPAVTPEPTTAPSPTRPDTARSLTVVPGWFDAGADASLFAGATITGAVAWQGSVVAVGCDQDAASSGRPTDAPIWVGGGAQWQRSAPVPLPGGEGAESAQVTCIDQVVATRHGLFAAAGAGVIHSDDGLTWDVVELDSGPGWVDAVMTSGDRVTVLTSHASLNESRVASLWTTIDGRTWSRVGEQRDEAGVGDDPAVVFDNGGVADVITVTGGLVAVGASPGGEFVPTAAVWTSTDSVTWQRATVEDAGDCYVTAVTTTSSGLVAAGWCTTTGQPALWASSDGAAWQRITAPVADLPPNSFVEVVAVTAFDDGVVGVAGSVFVGGTGTEGAAQWLLTDGWQRADDTAVPYHVVGGTGFWPPTGGETIAVLLAE